MVQHNSTLYKFIFIFLLYLVYNNRVFAQGLVELKPAPTTVEDLHYPTSVKYVQLPKSNIKLAFYDEGRGAQTLIFIHGIESYLPVWRKNLEVLPNHFRCIAMDLPGYGKSSRARYDASLTFQADAIKELLDLLGIKKVILVGHGMGGQIAVHLALKYPAQIDKLILISPTGFEAFTPEEATKIKSTFTQERIAAMPDSNARNTIGSLFYKMPPAAEYLIQDRMMMRKLPNFGNYCYVVSRGYKGMMDQPILDKLASLKQPTLFLWGLSDNIIPNKDLHPNLNIAQIAQMACEKITHCTQYIVPGAGHLAMFEQPELTNKYIVEFVKGKPKSAK